MTAVMLARLRAHGGEEAVAKLLRLAGSSRTSEYLSDTGNWISYDEAASLWWAGAQVTHHPQFARVVGEDAARRLSSSPVASLLRSLGSPEEVYRQIALAASKFATVSKLEMVQAGPGYAEVVATPSDELPRSADYCDWTCGLLSQPPVLFGLAPARVQHEQCAAFGADQCVYRISWQAHEGGEQPGSESLGSLHLQLQSMHDRLRSIFAIAADLIAAEDIAGVLGRITDRAAVEVRAPRYLLAVRFKPDGEIHCHQKGFDQAEVEQHANRILREHPASLPKSWLVVPVRSSRADYGRLMAKHDDDTQFFPQERELLEVYARYAASALDSATALMEAKERYAQSSALLRLARALAVAGTTDEIVRRLADAVPGVVDCDRVGVYMWDPVAGQLVRRASSRRDGIPEAPDDQEWLRSPSRGGPLSGLLTDPRPDPVFIDANAGDPALRGVVRRFGAAAAMLVPLVTQDSLLGLLTVSVISGEHRLQPTPDLHDRLSGVAAQAITALQNGHLVDHITHQALHDGLTGLANRIKFTAELRSAIAEAHENSRVATVFYIDLDGFKPINDKLGHDVGDGVLAAVGERLRSVMRTGDTVARLGGDEFAILVDAYAVAEEIDLIATRLAGAFRDPFVIGGRTVSVSASIGRAVYPTDADSADELLRHADSSMFEAKRARQDRRAGLPV